MELAKVTTKGQITIPVEIRKKLHLKPGDKVLFIEEDGKITFTNSSLAALSTIQAEMEGEAEKSGLAIEQEVVEMVRHIRKQRATR
jgi:antitoxin PrlF